MNVTESKYIGVDSRAKLGFESWKRLAYKIHKDKYDYSKVEYKNSKTKVNIICHTHGSFKQMPCNHSHLMQGCPKCSTESKAKIYSKSQSEALSDFKKVHGDRYDYSKVVYVNCFTKVTITCYKHGLFKQAPHNHMEGQGCTECGLESRAKLRTKSHEQFMKEFNRDDITIISNYVNTYTKLKCRCDICGNIWGAIPPNILRDRGCPVCAKHGFNPKKNAILYYLEINGGLAYKIGITNRTIKERFGSDMKNIKIIKTWNYEVGQDAFDQEQKILKEFKYAQYKGDSLLKIGNTELFNHDVLLLVKA